MTGTRPPDAYVLDDDVDLAAAVARCLRRGGLRAEEFSDPATLLEAYAAAPSPCVVSDVMMAPMDGFSFVRELRTISPSVAVVFMTAWPKVPDAVEAIRKLGGIDYLAKPVDEGRLLAAVDEAVRIGGKALARDTVLGRLTSREREVFDLLVRGLSSKAVASKLDISPRTVEDHRARIFAKIGTSTLAGMIALKDAAGGD